MGVDLALLPIGGELSRGKRCAFSLIECERDSDIWEAIEDLVKAKGQDATGLRSYMSDADGCEHCDRRGYGDTTQDAYGAPIKMLRARDLATLATLVNTSFSAWANAPIWAYLARLQPGHDDRALLALMSPHPRTMRAAQRREERT